MVRVLSLPSPYHVDYASGTSISAFGSPKISWSSSNQSSPPEGSASLFTRMDTSYLEKQVSTIINKLHELFDEIGVPSHDRDSRESELFAALSETLHNQLRLVTKYVALLRSV